jgi:hypothetical protein
MSDELARYDRPLTGEETVVLAELVAGSLGPLSRLSETLDLTLDQVSRWIVEPANREQISNLVTLLDAQTQLLICQQRLLAVARLVEVARNAESPETVRRACSDLLRIRLIDPYREDKRPAKMPPPPVFDEETILEALERMGREAHESQGAADRWSRRPAAPHDRKPRSSP